ncbi:MAG: Hydroxymethylpyrimidine ABC transporter, substrate-binding component, partial [uncultured Quadrisphaera sp.]
EHPAPENPAPEHRLEIGAPRGAPATHLLPPGCRPRLRPRGRPRGGARARRVRRRRGGHRGRGGRPVVGELATGRRGGAADARAVRAERGRRRDHLHHRLPVAGLGGDPRGGRGRGAGVLRRPVPRRQHPAGHGRHRPERQPRRGGHRPGHLGRQRGRGPHGAGRGQRRHGHRHARARADRHPDDDARDHRAGSAGGHGPRPEGRPAAADPGDAGQRGRRRRRDPAGRRGLRPLDPAARAGAVADRLQVQRARAARRRRGAGDAVEPRGLRRHRLVRRDGGEPRLPRGPPHRGPGLPARHPARLRPLPGGAAGVRRPRGRARRDRHVRRRAQPRRLGRRAGAGGLVDAGGHPGRPPGPGEDPGGGGGRRGQRTARARPRRRGGLRRRGARGGLRRRHPGVAGAV